MVLPSGETRVSCLSKSNLLSPALTLTGESEAVPVKELNQTHQVVGVTNDALSFESNEGVLTETQFLQNGQVLNGKDEFCFNEALYNLSSFGEFDDVNQCDGEVYTSKNRGFRGDTLAGRFDQACRIHDVSPSASSSASVPEGGRDMPNKTSPKNVLYPASQETRCLGGHDSWCSTQSETSCVNSRSDSIVDYPDVFPETSELSISTDEQMTMSVSETGSISYSPTPVKDSEETVVSKDTANLTGDALSSHLAAADDGRGDFDVFNVEMTLPYMNWDYLEEQLQRAIEKEQRNDREKIRQKLAMGLDEDQFSSSNDRILKKSSLQMRFNGTTQLQMCFINEASNDTDNSSMERSACYTSKEHSSSEKSKCQLLHSLPSSSSLNSNKSSVQSTLMTLQTPTSGAKSATDEPDFFTRQARLQAEARLALAQVRPMAHMQLQLEKQTRRKSPIAIIVGIPGFGDRRNGRLSQPILRQMNLGQLQVIVNDMHAQIEAFNHELMELLVDRDDLHMAQDSMLVDIEDLTRRAQEYDAKLKSKLTGNQH